MRGAQGTAFRKIVGWTSFLVLVVGLLLGGISLFLPGYLIKKVQTALRENCATCQLEIETLSINFFALPTHLSIKNIRFKDLKPGHEGFAFTAERIDAHVEPFTFLTQAPTIVSLELLRPHVTVEENESAPPGHHAKFPAPGAAFADFPAMRVDGITITNGHFTYALTVPSEKTPGEGQPPRGQIDVTQIFATIDSFATRESLLTPRYQHRLNARATAKLENEGDVDFNLSFDPYAAKNHDILELRVRNEPLSNISSFFETEAGMEFGGVLNDGLAHLELSEGVLQGYLSVDYEGLRIKFHATPERSKLSAALTNWIASIKTAKDHSVESDTETMPTHVSSIREPNEAVTKWIIRGLRDAAKKAITS